MKGSGAQTTHGPAEPGTYRMCSAAKTARHRIVVMLLTQVSQCGKRTVFLVWARVLRKSAGGYGEEEKKTETTSSHRLSWTGVATGTCTVQRQTGRYMWPVKPSSSPERTSICSGSPRGLTGPLLTPLTSAWLLRQNIGLLPANDIHCLGEHSLKSRPLLILPRLIPDAAHAPQCRSNGWHHAT